MKLKENVQFDNCQFTENIDGSRLIHNVVLLGPVSQHGYKYSQAAMQKAVSENLYTNVRCFINHASPDEERIGRRDLMKLAGVIESARYDGKIKGDIRLLDDEYGRKFWNIAKTMPAAASCSHCADGELETAGGQRQVTSIKHVESVDLVVKGATTSSVFESAGQSGHSNADVNTEGFSSPGQELPKVEFEQLCADVGVKKETTTESGTKIVFD